MTFCLLDDGRTRIEIERQWFLAEHMLAGAQCIDDLGRMQRGRGNEKNRIDLRVCEQRLITFIQTLDAERVASRAQFVRNR